MFNQLQPMLVRYAATMLYSREDALEVVQEVFIKMWQKRGELEFGEHLKAYMYRSVRNQAINRIQRNKIDTVSLEDGVIQIPNEEETGPDRQEQSSQMALIHREIARLPTNCREIFLMSRMEGLSHTEIAEVLDISTKTVENQIGIALKKIRKGVFRKS